MSYMKVPTQDTTAEDSRSYRRQQSPAQSYPSKFIIETQHDLHTRLWRFFTHLGLTDGASFVDTFSAYPFYIGYFLSGVLIPYAILLMLAKVLLPLYYSSTDHFCDAPLSEFLLFRFCVDLVIYLVLFSSSRWLFQFWKECFVVDMSLLFCQLFVVFDGGARTTLCPVPLVVMSQLLTWNQLIFYAFLVAALLYRFFFIPRDDYHVSWFSFPGNQHGNDIMYSQLNTVETEGDSSEVEVGLDDDSLIQ